MRCSYLRRWVVHLIVQFDFMIHSPKFIQNIMNLFGLNKLIGIISNMKVSYYDRLQKMAQICSNDELFEWIWTRQVNRSDKSFIYIYDSIFFPGKRVFVRRYPEDKHPVPCETINGDHSYSLIREIETGHYFRAQVNLIEYPDEPQFAPIYEVSFQPTPLDPFFIVSYVIKNLRWQTRFQTYSDRPHQFQSIYLSI